MSIGVSVIICCYNSKTRIKPTLAHIAKQKINTSIPWEIVIVDNNSTDGTAQYISDIWSSFTCDTYINIVQEKKNGLSYARETGILAAQYEYLLFCDDDNWLNENYVQLVYDIMSVDDKIGALGGWGKGVYEKKGYKNFEHVKRYYAIEKPYFKTTTIDVLSHHIYGAGMCIRKFAYKKLKENHFDFILTGRSENENTSGEDIELILALSVLGYKIYFDERLSFKHFIPANRLALSYPMQRITDGRPALVFSAYRDHILGHPNSIIFYALKFLKSLIHLLRALFMEIKSSSYAPKMHRMECIAFSKALLVNYRLYVRTRNQARQLKL